MAASRSCIVTGIRHRTTFHSTWPIRGAHWRRRREVAVSSRTSIRCHDCRCGRLPWDAFGMSDVRQADSGERRSGVRQACLGISRALPGKIRFDARSNSGQRSCKEAIRAIVMVLKPSGAAPCHSLQNADCSARRQRPLIMPLTWPARMACHLPRRTCVTRGYATTRSLVSCLVPGTSIASMNVPAYRPSYHIHQKPGTPARRLSDS